MNAIYKLLILLGVILRNNTILTSTIIRNNICYGTSKFCFYCSQESGVIIFHQPFKPHEYRLQIMDKVNRARSNYTLTNGISNMKFSQWNSELEALTGGLVGFSKPIVECNDINNGNEETKKKYKIIEYKSEVSMVRKKQDIILNEQFQNLTEKLFADPVMMIHNLNQFGCSYSYNLERSKLIGIMRCIGYIENRLNKTQLTMGKPCDACDFPNERCIELDWYEGLCVHSNFNETRLRLMIEPEVELPWVMPYQLMFRISIYVLNVVVLFVIVYVVYAGCVVCRHNRIFGIIKTPNERTIETVPMVENIYNHI